MPEHQQIEQSKKPEPTFQKQATHVSQSPVSNPFSIIQRAKINPKSLSRADVMQLQRTIGNRAVGRLLSGLGNPSKAQQAPVQRQEIPEEDEELLQGKFTDECVQCQGPEDEEELLQGKIIETIQRQEPEEEELIQSKFETIQQQEPEEEELMQGKFTDECVQCQLPEDEEEPLQGKFASGLTGTLQAKKEAPPNRTQYTRMIRRVSRTLQAKKEAPPNRTGMPDHLKSGLENLSGIDLSGVRVHYSSPKPAQLNALAYTQGQEIHVAPGQEKQLPHEGWHVVQQMQGRVKPTSEVGGLPLNDSRTLESEADSMGRMALQMYAQVEKPKENTSPAGRQENRAVANAIAQKKNGVKQGFGFVDNRPKDLTQRKLQEITNDSPQMNQLTAFQEKASNSVLLEREKKEGIDSQNLVQFKGGKGAKTTADFLDEYEREQGYKNDAYDDVTQELWEDEVDVMNYANQKLLECKYLNWHDTDSSQGDYCRFIWHFDHNVKVGLNVHYLADGKKAAGHMYIKDIHGMEIQTPKDMVDNAPLVRPATTRAW